MIIKSPHPSIDQPNTYLTAPAAAAATTLTVANNASFVTDDYAILGVIGQEKTTINKVSGVTDDDTINLTGSALKFSLSENTPVTYIKYNQVKFYLGDWSSKYNTGSVAINKGSKILTGSGTSWGAITTGYALLLNEKWYDIASIDSTTQITLTEAYQGENIISSTYALVPFTVQATIDISPDQLETIWDDTDALTEDFYRTEYYNSTSDISSTRSSIISADEPEGFSEFSLKILEDSVLDKLRDPDALRISRDEIDNDLNDCLRILVNTIVSDVQEDYLGSFNTIDLIQNVTEYPLFDDFRKLTSVWVSYDGVTYKKATRLKIGDILPNTTYSESYPYYYVRDNVIGFLPIPGTAMPMGAKVWYERRIPSLKNQGDEIPFLLRDFKHMFVTYALWQALWADDKPKAEGYRQTFTGGLNDVVDSLVDRDRGENEKITITQDEELFGY